MTYINKEQQKIAQETLDEISEILEKSGIIDYRALNDLISSLAFNVHYSHLNQIPDIKNRQLYLRTMKQHDSKNHMDLVQKFIKPFMNKKRIITV